VHAFDGMRDENLADATRTNKGNGGVLRHRGLAARVGSERRRRISQRKDEAAMADAVTVRHRRGDRHRETRSAWRDIVQSHAEFATGAILGPHSLGARAHVVIHVWFRANSRPSTVMAGLDPAIIRAPGTPAPASP
jgi:hypothetical protein